MKTNLFKVAARASVVAAGMAVMPGLVIAQDGGMTSDLDASIRLGVQLKTEPDTEITAENFGSRIRWSGSADLDSGGSIISYLELGFDQDAGVNVTREGWAGLSGASGTFTIGKQYTAVYDAVTSKIDIALTSREDSAFPGSCTLEGPQCVRQSSVLKFASVPQDGMQIHASTQLVDDGADAELLNGLDLAVSVDRGDTRLGAGLAYLGEGNGRVDNGFALTVGATADAGAGTASAVLGFATDDYLGGQDDGFSITGTYAQDNIYAVAGFGSADTDPFYLTLGLVNQLIADRALMYFEVGINDSDVPGADTALIGRSVLVFNFGKNYSTGT